VPEESEAANPRFAWRARQSAVEAPESCRHDELLYSG